MLILWQNFKNGIGSWEIGMEKEQEKEQEKEMLNLDIKKHDLNSK